MLPPTVSTNLTFPVRRLDQTLEAWRESQISSGTGEFDLRIYVLNFALHSPTQALLCSPQETQVLGERGSVSKLHHPHRHTQSHCHLQKSALRNVSRGCAPRNLRKQRGMVTGVQAHVTLCTLPSRPHGGLHDHLFRILAQHLTASQLHLNVLLQHSHVTRPPRRVSAYPINQDKPGSSIKEALY